MFRTSLLTLVLGLGVAAIATPEVQAQCCDTSCDSCLKCPSCNATCCELVIDDAKKEGHCFEVECKEICIPNVVFPWQKSCCNPCYNNGACVRTIRVMKKKKYECPTCSYEWVAKDLGCGGSCCGAGCCDAGGCDTGCCDQGVIMSVPATAAPEQAAPAEGSVVPAVPQAAAPTQPSALPTSIQSPSLNDSTSRQVRGAAIPVRFLRAVKAKVLK